ncbi:MAG: PEPxxWA-CTERM sorting domain-containing protein [Phenylobacterium sp.]|nr:PEPxxWA-CTERM sorting domain-containing protein [Phenylobacterium sp.]
MNHRWTTAAVAALSISLALGAGGSAQAAVSVAAYDAGADNLIDFDDVTGAFFPGVSYDGILVSGGASFAERFVGQALSFSGDLDVLSGAPTGPLTLQTGAAGQNLAVGMDNGANGLLPCGALGCATGAGYGEGAFAVLFAGPVSYFGFQQFFSDGGVSGLTTVDFFNLDGDLIDRVSVTSSGAVAFQRDGGIKDIAGVSVFTGDPGGLAYDSFIFDTPGSGGGTPGGGGVGAIPEPSTWALMIGGFGLAGAALRRRRGVLAA